MKRDNKGYIHLDGKKFDEFVRLQMKYSRSGDTDLLEALVKAEDECFGSTANVCGEVIGSYIGFGHHYTMHSMPRIVSLASFVGYKVDYD